MRIRSFHIIVALDCALSGDGLQISEFCETYHLSRRSVFRYLAFLHSLGAATLGGGLVVGFFAWLGFIITSMAVNNGFGGRNITVTAIDGGHWLTVLLVMGLIIGAFG